MTRTRLHTSPELLALIQANAPYWAAEAEVIASYWNSPVRTVETDRKWLLHQIYKEYWDGVLPPLATFQSLLPAASEQAGRDALLEISEVLHEEVEHFAMFANLYQTLEGSDYKLSPDQLKVEGSWQENDVLMALRTRHTASNRAIGERANRFTEGGYCALFTVGRKLAGDTPFDAAVAEVCEKIYDDEFNHMLLGILEIDENHLSSRDWESLNQFSVEQMRQRIRMRNAQFSSPVTQSRLEELLAGSATPVEFDFDYAAQLLTRDNPALISGQ